MSIERSYVVEAQLLVTATDPAVAEEAVKTGVAAVQATLAAQSPPVTLAYEEQDGMPVLAEQ